MRSDQEDMDNFVNDPRERAVEINAGVERTFEEGADIGACSGCRNVRPLKEYLGNRYCRPCIEWNEDMINETNEP